MATNFRLFLVGENAEPAMNPSNALLAGIGTSTVQPESAEANKNWLSFFVKSTATSGTSRGMYLRLYLPSNAGGEALRAFTTVSSNTPADTVNGAHISLSFGASAGNVTGESQALRSTFHLGNRTMTGANAAIKAELWADGSSSDINGTTSFLRFSAGGNATGVAKIDTSGYFFAIDGLTASSGKLFRVAAPSTLAASLRVLIGATAYYLPLYSAQA